MLYFSSSVCTVDFWYHPHRKTEGSHSVNNNADASLLLSHLSLIHSHSLTHPLLIVWACMCVCWFQVWKVMVKWSSARCRTAATVRWTSVIAQRRGPCATVTRTSSWTPTECRASTTPVRGNLVHAYTHSHLYKLTHADRYTHTRRRTGIRRNTQTMTKKMTARTCNTHRNTPIHQCLHLTLHNGSSIYRL